MTIKPGSQGTQPILVMLNPKDTLEELKLKIYEQKPDLNPDYYILVFRGKVIEPFFRMEAFYIQPDEVIHLVEQNII